MGEKKVVDRKVAIVLGIMCVVLAVGLVGVVAYYTAIVNLEKSETWVSQQTVSQPARGYYSWIFSASYAGYIVVTVHSSTTSNTYVRVIWSSHGVDYDNTVYVGAGGTAVFPVLPCSRVEIRVGNTNLLSGATQTVSITYRY